MNTAAFKLKTRYRQEIFSGVLLNRSPAKYARESNPPSFLYIYRTERKNLVGIQEVNIKSCRFRERLEDKRKFGFGF